MNLKIKFKTYSQKPLKKRGFTWVKNYSIPNKPRGIRCVQGIIKNRVINQEINKNRLISTILISLNKKHKIRAKYLVSIGYSA